jgi:hypothetical protein
MYRFLFLFFIQVFILIYFLLKCLYYQILIYLVSLLVFFSQLSSFFLIDSLVYDNINN